MCKFKLKRSFEQSPPSKVIKTTDMTTNMLAGRFGEVEEGGERDHVQPISAKIFHNKKAFQ